MDIELVFRIAAIGILVAILHTVLQRAGRDELGQLATLVGVVIVLVWVIRLVRQLFDTVRVMFQL
ncbi:MAG: stage III sporulation protein AC [Acetobacteraceae bacterium]|nr:stage III sporulation protein AC [Acetobacteraceae bacterium]